MVPDSGPVAVGRPALDQRAQDIPPNALAAREWFRDAKFGMFIHWGVYCLLGQGEWVMQNRSHPGRRRTSGSRRRSTRSKFDAREWVTLAKAAGVRYITITSRHHDGFSMFAHARRRRTTSSTGRRSGAIR